MSLLINLLRILQIVVLIRVMMTWIMQDPQDPRLKKITDPVDAVLKHFQVLIPIGGRGFVDIGPVLCLLLLQVIERVLWHFV